MVGFKFRGSNDRTPRALPEAKDDKAMAVLERLETPVAEDTRGNECEARKMPGCAGANERRGVGKETRQARKQKSPAKELGWEGRCKKRILLGSRMV